MRNHEKRPAAAGFLFRELLLRGRPRRRRPHGRPSRACGGGGVIVECCERRLLLAADVGPAGGSPAPGAPNLVATFDTGASSTDNLTNRDNSTPDKALRFTVGGTTAGAVVMVYAGGTFIGRAVAPGATTTVTTNGTVDLADGARFITARQTVSGQPQSPDSPALGVTIDTAAPAADVNDVSEPRTTPVANVTVTFSEAVTGFDFADLMLTRNGVNVPLSASNNPTSGNGGVTWTISNLSTPTNPSGTYVLVVNAAGSGIADVAGNALAANASDVWINSNALPVVTDVFVRGTAWNTAFLNSLAAAGLGDAASGFRIPADAQTSQLPWTNLDRVSIRFSENVNVAADDLVVRGVNNATYPLAAGGAFTYDQFTFTATWTLSAAGLPADKVLLDLDADAGTGVTDINNNRLDGDWTNPVAPATGGADTFPSGNGTPGGDFRFRLDVLPASIDRAGPVNLGDFGRLRSNFGVTPPTATSIFADLNGDAAVNLADFGALRQRFNSSLPAGNPA